MDEQIKKEVLQIVALLPKRIRELLLNLPPNLLNTLTELRLRANGPMLMVSPTRSFYITVGGKPTYMPSEHLFYITQHEIQDIVTHACGYSVHSHQEDFKNGYLTVTGGHRIGLCGTAVTENGQTVGIREISALNIRIAKEIPHAAEETLRICFQSGLQNLLLVGAPMSGKTTVLRALAKEISSGYIGTPVKCAVIDERGELFPSDGSVQNSQCTMDVLSGYSKSDGISLAVRALSPDIIFCDEIGSREDVNAITEGIRCGVHFVATAHANTSQALYQRQKLKPLFADRVFDTLLFLGTKERVGKVTEIIKAGEDDAENGGNPADSGILHMDGNLFVRAGA